MHRRARAVTNAVAALALVGGALHGSAVQAHVAPRLTPLHDLGIGRGEAVASDGLGHAVLVWLAPNAASDASVVKASFLRLNGEWAVPRVISPKRGRSAATVDVAMDGMGRATVVWTTVDGQALLATRWAQDSGWSQPRVLVHGTSMKNPCVDAAGSGNVAITWAHTEVDGNQVAHGVTVAMVRTPHGGWQDPQVLSKKLEDPQVKPVVAMSPKGVATVVWASHAGADSILTSRWWPRSAKWSTAHPLLETGLDIGTASLAGDGNALLAAWDVSGPMDAQGLSETTVYAATRKGPGGWDSAKILDTYASRPALTSDPRVGVVGTHRAVSWLRRGTAGVDVMASTSRPAGTWRPPAVVASAHGTEALDADDTNDFPLALDGRGRVWLGWVSAGVDHRERPMLSRWSNGAWSAPTALGPREQRVVTPQVAALGGQRVVAAWTVITETGKPSRIKRRESIS